MRNGLVEGVSLRAVLQESGAMAPEAAVSVLAGTLLTLAGVHGDVRPENVLVDASGGLTLTGFGAPDPEFTPDEPTYLAPERTTGGPATPAADVFAATAVFFECLTAEPPFRAATPEDLEALHEYTQIIAEFAPEELRPLIQRGLAASPDARPESPHSFLTEVDSAATEAYGADWQARGRALLGTWATAAAATDGTELAEPDAMPEPPPVGEPIDERLLGLDGAGEEDLLSAEAPAAEPEQEGSEAEVSASEVGSMAELAAGAREAEQQEVEAQASEAESADEPDAEIFAADGDLAADDLLSAFDDLAPHPEPAEAPAEAPAAAEAEAEAPSAPTTTLVIESGAEATAKLDPLVPPSVQADIDHDWEIPAKPSVQAPRPLSAYANSLPSLPRPTPAEPEVVEPVATSAPDDWFRPGMAEPVDRGPRPVRQTAFLDPDKERTTVAPAYEDDDAEFDEREGPGDPGGPRRKTLVGAVTAAVLLVAGAAAVVLGGTGDSGPAPAAQSSTGGPGAETPSGGASPGTPSGTDNSSLLQTSAGNVPVSRHSSSHSSSKTTNKTTPSTSATSSSSAPTSQDSTTSHSSSNSPTSPSGTPSSGPTSTPTGTGSSDPSHSSSSSPSSDHTSTAGKPSH
ncbi:MAG: hypothetical protein HOV83_08660 [Catenulispora sp.]|nr:hypothetical protein [Catenulispora sp.]